MSNASLKPSGKLVALIGLLCLLTCSAASQAAGILSAKNSAEQPIRIREHHLDVKIINGFARTQVTQTFFNPNTKDLEAVYSFPVPRSASLAEVTVWNGENKIEGEVVERQEAQRIYQQERDAGNETALADKNSYQNFEFGVAPVRANSEVKIEFVYYQPLEIDTGVGRYAYPLRDGQTDDVAQNFWSSNTKVDSAFSAAIEINSAWPLSDVRLPNTPDAAVTKVDNQHWTAKFDREGGSLDQDLVVYYKLADNLPGRVEVIPYRADPNQPGTFMMVVTPGIDLKPLNSGSDYVFVLDCSGSMREKIRVLADGVTKVLGQMKPQDRFRIIAFNTSAQEVVGWTDATPQNVTAACEKVKSLTANGSTNMHDGLRMALGGLDDDRVTSIVLVTDGVTNTGVIDPREFDKLMRQYDVRVFGFLMGNSSNWPLMRTICNATGGFYAAVSNDDDIVGQIILAKNKVLYESLHDVSVQIRGVETENVTDRLLGKVYRGQQLVLFGQYDNPGKATFTLKARLSGEDKTYTTTFDLPQTDTANPEIERLWAMNQVELVEDRENRGMISATDSRNTIRELGLKYQIVTDYTSMLVLSNELFERHGIARNNQPRVAAERQAQSVRSSQPAPNYRVDNQQPTFSAPAPGLGGGGGGGSGGGAVDPMVVLFAAGLAGVALVVLRQPKGAL